MFRRAGSWVASLAVFSLTAGLAASCLFDLPEPLRPDDVVWIRRFGGDGDQVAHGVAIDSKGCVLVAGTFEGTLAFSDDMKLVSAGHKDIFLVKLDPEGTPQWSQQFGGVGDDESGVRGRGPIVAVDADDNVILTGTVVGAADLGGGAMPGVDGGSDAFALKLNANGALVWSKRFMGADDQNASGVAVDSNGDVLVTGTMAVGINFGDGYDHSFPDPPDLFLVRLDGFDGTAMGSNRVGGDGGEQKGLTLGVDSSDNVVVAGSLNGTLNPEDDENLPVLTSDPNKEDILLLKFDPGLDGLWGRRLEGATTPTVGYVAVTPSGDILLTGYFRGWLALDGRTILTSEGNSDDVFLLLFDKEGTLTGTNRFGNELDGQVGWGIAIAGGQVLVTGSLTGDVAFGPLMHEGHEDTSRPDGFVLKMSAINEPLWERPLSGPGTQVGYGIAADPRGYVVMVGATDGTITSLDPPITSQGGDDIIVVKLAP
jgi:hypothetical protein